MKGCHSHLWCREANEPRASSEAGVSVWRTPNPSAFMLSHSMHFCMLAPTDIHGPATTPKPSAL